MDKYIIRDTSTTLIIGFLIFLAFWIGKRGGGGSGGVRPTTTFTATMNVGSSTYATIVPDTLPTNYTLNAYISNNSDLGLKLNSPNPIELGVYNFSGDNDLSTGTKDQQFDLNISVTDTDTNLTSPTSTIGLVYLCFLDDVKLLTPMGYKSAPELAINDLVIDDNGQFRKITEIYCREVMKEEENEDWKLYTNGMSTFSHWHSIKDEKEYHNFDLQEFIFVHKHRQFAPIKKEFPYTLYNVKVEEGSHLITQCGNIIESMNGLH